jgi:hypothetical protein
MLHNIQKQFLQAVFNSDTNPDILTSISNSGSRSAVEQLQSYRDSVIGGIKEALVISYPVVYKLVGEEFFNYITQQYIQDTPSVSPDLNDYGHNFSDFLDTLKNLESAPYLSDVARLEWCWQKIINGSNCKPGNLDLLTSLSDNETDNIVFKLNIHTSLLHSDYAIHKIWKKNQSNNTNNAELNIDAYVDLIIWRHGLDMNITIINENQFFFLNLISQSIPFPEVCEQHITRYPEDDITALLSNAIQSNWIESFSLNP